MTTRANPEAVTQFDPHEVGEVREFNDWGQPYQAVTVAIPAIPPRRFTLLPKALASVARQTYPVAAVSIAFDVARLGAPANRSNALAAVTTPWVAFLDDDDEFYPQHVDHLLGCALENDADYVFSHYDLARTGNVFATAENPHGHWGKPFDPEHPHHTTMTILVRTELAHEVDFTPRPEGDDASGEDWRFTLGCVDAGAKIVHLPEQTWYWRHHFPHNTSGRADRW